MKVICLDIRDTHEHNPDCPMRIAQHPNGSYWYCIDCGCPILCNSVGVIDEPIFNKIMERQEAERSNQKNSEDTIKETSKKEDTKC